MTFSDVHPGDPINAANLQQVIDALKGTAAKGVPLAVSAVNDSTRYALTLENLEATNSRAINVLKSDGSVLIRADATGVTLGAPLNLTANSVPGSAIQNATITNAKLGTDVARANLLVNGGFEIWQRGNGPFSGNGVYTADRWQIVTPTSTVSVSRDTTNKANSSNAALAVTTTYTSGVAVVYQPFKVTELGLQGKSCTLSVMVKCSTPNAVRISLTPNGTGGAAVLSAFHTGDGTYQTLTVTAPVPADATSLDVTVANFAASATAYIDNAMLVVGSQACDYVPMHPADDLARCLRYYETFGFSASNTIQVSGWPANTTQSPGTTVPYRAIKPVAPTVTKVGTWTVVNAGQPIVLGSTGEFFMYAVPSAAGYVNVYAGSSANGITVESNP